MKTFLEIESSKFTYFLLKYKVSLFEIFGQNNHFELSFINLNFNILQPHMNQCILLSSNLFLVLVHFL